MRQNYQLSFQMPDMINPAQSDDIADAILKGGRTIDVAITYGCRYIICREIVHKKCRKENPEAYKRLNIEAAHNDCSSPPIRMLQANSHLFITPPEKRDESLIQRELDEIQKRITQADLELRILRVTSAHREYELNQHNAQ